MARQRRNELSLLRSRRRDPHLASPADVAERAEEWSDEVLECRTYGHSWAPHRAQHIRQWRYFYIVQICPRCTTTRHMELSESGGEIFDSWYEYPEGYLSKNLGRIVGDARGQLRLATISRTFQIEELGAKKARQEARPPHGNTRRATGWAV